MGVMAALLGASALMQAASQRSQAREQASAYKAQAKAEQQNAAIKANEASRIADDYAAKQKRINDRLRLARGQALASAGASGIDGSAGSVLDNLSAIDEGGQADSQDLLRQQRENTWARYVEEVNHRNRANAYTSAAKNVKRQGDMAALGTLVGAAASIYGKGLFGSSSTKKLVTGSTPDMSVGAFRKLNEGAW